MNLTDLRLSSDTSVLRDQICKFQRNNEKGAVKIESIRYLLMSFFVIPSWVIYAQQCSSCSATCKPLWNLDSMLYISLEQSHKDLCSRLLQVIKTVYVIGNAVGQGAVHKLNPWKSTCSSINLTDQTG